jgi:hypothetical protein
MLSTRKNPEGPLTLVPLILIVLPDGLPVKPIPEIRNAAAVELSEVHDPEMVTSNASAVGVMTVEDAPAPMTLIFLLDQETELVHEQEPAGMYTPSPLKLVGLT